MVQILLDAEADVDVVKEYSVRCLIARDGFRGGTALELAAEAGHREGVEMLLAAKVEANPRYIFHRWTPLEAAAGGGHRDVVQALVDAEAERDGGKYRDGIMALPEQI